MLSSSELFRIPHKILEEAYKAGIDREEKNRAGALLHIDQTTIYSEVNELYKGQIEILDTKEALRKYHWLEEYRWKLIDPRKDEYTEKVAENYSGGYFLRIFPHAEVALPLQTCLMITQEQLEQKIHNIVIAEENSKAHIISGCVQHSDVERAAHIGISEFYVNKNATLNFTMIHSWNEGTFVRPRSAASIKDGGQFVSNYLCLKPVKDLQMYPVATCMGENSRAVFNSILYGHKGSLIDVGSKAVLNGPNSRTEMISRAVSREGSTLIVRGLVEGNESPSKGHLECKGIILDDKSSLQSIPELVARKSGCEITHEAAVGKISENEIIYLMTRKIPYEKAVSMIIRGFMDTSILGLPPSLEREVSQIIDQTTMKE